MDYFNIYLSPNHSPKRGFRTGPTFLKVLAGKLFQKKLIMRLKYATFLILISCLHVFASGHAQKVTLSARNASLLEVMDQIEKQTGYTFWMQSQLMRDVSKVNIQAKNASLTTVLDKLFGKHKLEYTIIEKTIVVRSSRSGQQESFQ